MQPTPPLVLHDTSVVTAMPTPASPGDTTAEQDSPAVDATAVTALAGCMLETSMKVVSMATRNHRPSDIAVVELVVRTGLPGLFLRV